MTNYTKKKLKGAAKSKLIWVGFLLATLGYTWELLPSVKDSIPLEWFPLISMGVGALVMGLRWITEEGLHEKV